MEPATATVIQPAHALRLQISPGAFTAKTRDTAQAASYTWNAFLDGKPIFDNLLDLPLERLPAHAKAGALPPLPSYGRYDDPSDARALSELIFASERAAEMAGTIRSILAENDGYLRVQLQADGAEGEVHDLPWEYLALPGSDGEPLAADERTPFARLLGRPPRAFRPGGERTLRALVVLEAALADKPDAAKPDSAVFQLVDDSLAGLMETGELQVTLLAGAIQGTGDGRSRRVDVVYAPLRAYAKELAAFDILQFAPASRSGSYGATDPYDTRKAILSKDASSTAPLPGDRYSNLGWTLDSAGRLPPLMVLPSDFVRQSQARRLTRWGDQGTAAVLELPLFDPEPAWIALQLFFERLLEHGIADIALNQLRRSWIGDRRFPPQLPILWTAVEDGRLFARPVESAGEQQREKPPEEKAVPAPFTEPESGQARAPQIWFVPATSEQYDWNQAFKEGRVRWTGVSGNEAQQNIRATYDGDLVIAYRSTPDKYITGLGHIAGQPYEITADNGTRHAVEIIMDLRLEQGVTLDELRAAVPDLQHVQRTRPIGWSPVTPEQWTVIRELMRYHNPGLEDKLPPPMAAKASRIEAEPPDFSGSKVAGEPARMAFRLHNRGNTTWASSGSYGVRIEGAWQSDDPSRSTATWEWTRRFDQPTPPGAIVELRDLEDNLPGEAGEYLIHWAVAGFDWDPPVEPVTLSSRLMVEPPPPSDTETGQPRRAPIAGPEEEPAQEAAPAEKPAEPGGAAQPQEAVQAQQPAEPQEPARPAEKPAEGEAARTDTGGAASSPEGRAAAAADAAAGEPAGGQEPAGGVTHVQVGAVNINQAVFPLERYQPPAADNVMTIRVSRDTVLLQFDAKDGSRTDYTGRNLLADEAHRQEILKANNDPRRYGNLLFDAIIHNNPGPHGRIEETTEKGWDLALQKTGKELRIELILDKSSPDNLQMHEYRWEYLRRGARTPVALLPRSPFYRRLAQSGGSLLVDRDQQKLKVLVAICNPSAQARAGFGLIGALPPLQVGLEREIATLALERLERAGLLEKRILPENPEQAVTRRMLLDALKDGFHVLHLVGHGVFVGDNPPGDYYLAIEGTAGQPPFVAAEDVGAWMNATPKLRLVVLAACQSAVSSSGDALRGLGPRLVLDGQAPAVIAMQQKLPFPTAQLFMQSFYDDLARSGRVDMALAATRQTIFDQEGGDSGTWAIPVLFMGASDGQLIETDRDRAGRLLPPVPDIRTYRQLGAREDPQMAALNQTLANEAQAIGAQHLVDAFRRTARAATAGPSAPLAVQQDRDRLTGALDLDARVDAARMRDFVRDATGRVKIEGGVQRRVGSLELPMDAYRQIAATLNKGKHIILIGAPGTGKTTLAQAICKYAQTRSLCTAATVATATADWTTFDTVGGYVPTAEQTLEFRAGSFLQAIGKGEWLVIDEINRAEIDKAFGELFTVLSGQRVDTPYMVGPHRVCVLPPARFDANDQNPERWIPKSDIAPGGYDYVVHPQWRIIGTMNVYDRSALYSLSLAFMRRFAFIDLDLPENYIELCGEWIEDDGRITVADDLTLLQGTLRALLDRGSALMQRRALGPAIVRDMIGHVGECYAPGASVVALLAEAFLLYAAPQLDGLSPEAIQLIRGELRTIFGAAAEDKRLLKRIADLYPFVVFAD